MRRPGGVSMLVPLGPGREVRVRAASGAERGAMAHVTSEMPVASLTQPVSHTSRGMRARVPVDRPVTTTARTVSFTIR